METRILTIKNKDGIHLRPSALIVSSAQKYNCKIIIKKNKEIAEARSITDIMLLALKKDTKIELICDGEDETKAICELSELLEKEFNFEK